MLDKGADYIAEARRTLNDTESAVYRYADATLYSGLGMGLEDMDRLRPDILINATIPILITADTSLTFVDPRYRRALLDYVVGYAELQDVEAADTARATAFMASFTAKLTGAAS